MYAFQSVNYNLLPAKPCEINVMRIEQAYKRNEVITHPLAAVQDRDGAVPLLKLSRGRHPLVKLAYADSAYSSPWVAMATSIGIEIVRKFADQTGFVVHPRRWVVERTSRGSIATDAPPRTLARPSDPPPPSFMPPQL